MLLLHTIGLRSIEARFQLGRFGMKKTFVFIIIFMLVLSLVACSGGETGAVVEAQEIEDSSVPSSNGETIASTSADFVEDALAENSEAHDNAEDYVWDSSTVIPIVLIGNTITVTGGGVTVDGSRATITSSQPNSKKQILFTALI